MAESDQSLQFQNFHRLFMETKQQNRVFCCLCQDSDAHYSEEGLRQHCKRWHHDDSFQKTLAKSHELLQQKVVTETLEFLTAVSDRNKDKPGQKLFCSTFGKDTTQQLSLWAEDHHTACQLTCVYLNELGK